jgi:hypothetical protein
MVKFVIRIEVILVDNSTRRRLRKVIPSHPDGTQVHAFYDGKTCSFQLLKQDDDCRRFANHARSPIDESEVMLDLK